MRLNLLTITILLFLTYSGDIILCQTPQISIGIEAMLDANIYKFYDNKFSDLDGKTSISLGPTYGFYTILKPVQRWQIRVGFNRSQKFYSPKRLFSFGTLETVATKSIEITGTALFNLTTESKRWQKYAIAGVDFEHETSLETTYTQFNGEEIFFSEDFIIPKVGLGISGSIDENEKWHIRPEIILRLRPVFSEYLHPILNKLSLCLSIDYLLLK